MNTYWLECPVARKRVDIVLSQPTGDKKTLGCLFDAEYRPTNAALVTRIKDL
jgi:hypothetical protein